MTRCYNNCKHRCFNFCEKYGERILVSTVSGHSGLSFHPLHYLSLYYTNSNDLEHLIKIAEKYSTKTSSKNICEQYRKTSKITNKQRKLLVYNILNNCYEDRYSGEVGND